MQGRWHGGSFRCPVRASVVVCGVAFLLVSTSTNATAPDLRPAADPAAGPAAGPAGKTRKRLLVATVATVTVVAVAAAVLVPAHLERQRVERMTLAATQDAAALTSAHADAEVAASVHAEALVVLRDVLDTVALPFTEATLELVDDDGRVRLTSHVEELAALLGDEGPPAPPVLAEPFADAALVEVLTERYVATRGDEELAAVQADRDAEIARLAGVAEDALARTATLHEAARGFVTLVAETAPAVVVTARSAPVEHDRASEETRAQLDAAAAAVESLAELVLDPEATIQDVRTAALALDPSASDRVRALGAAVGAVRTSHAEVVAAEEQAAREAAERAARKAEQRRSAARGGSGGSGGGSGGGCQFIPMGLTMTFVCH